MRFEMLKAYARWPSSIRVMWEIDNQELFGIYKFRVKVFDGNDSVIHDSGIIPDDNVYLVTYLPLLHNEIRQNLIIEVTCIPPKIDCRRGWKEFSKRVTLYSGQNENARNIACRIREKERMLFECKVGTMVHIYKRKKYGEACTECRSTIGNVNIKSKCESCFGTKFKGGYHKPIELYAHIEETQPVDKTLTNEFNVLENKYCNIRFTDDTLVSREDLIVDVGNNTIWQLVQEPQMIKFQTVPIGQITVCTAVTPKSILHKLVDA